MQYSKELELMFRLKAKDSGIEINSVGTRHLGVGTPDFKRKYVEKKVDGWVNTVKNTLPARSMDFPVSRDLFQPLEDGFACCLSRLC